MKKKSAKKVPGKSNVKAVETPAFKPSVYLDGKQVPKELQNAKPGQKVQLMATGKVIRTSDDLGMGKTVVIEMDKMSAAPKKGKAGR